MLTNYHQKDILVLSLEYDFLHLQLEINLLENAFSGYMDYKFKITRHLQIFLNGGLLVYIPLIAGIILFLISFPLKKLMHEVH